MDKDEKKVIQLRSDDPEFYKKFVEEWNATTKKLKNKMEKENEEKITSKRISNSAIVFR